MLNVYVPVRLPDICQMYSIACRYTCTIFNIHFACFEIYLGVQILTFFYTVVVKSHDVSRGFLVEMNLVYDVYFLF